MTLPSHDHLQPYLAVDDAERAVAFYVGVFGFTERYRLPMPDGRVGHAELGRGNVRLLLSDAFPEIGATPPAQQDWPVSLLLYVEDLDATVAAAEAAGACIVSPPKDEFFGDRAAKLIDPFGHRWFLHQMLEALGPEEIRRRFAERGAP